MILSPSTATCSRNVPCIAGCCGPRFRICGCARPIDSAYFLARSTTGRSIVSVHMVRWPGGKSLRKGMSLELRVRQDAPQIRMAFELDSEHVERFALRPVRAFPDVDGAVDGGILGRDGRLDPHTVLVRERKQVVDDVVPILALRQVVHGRHVQQHFEIERRIGLQRAQDLLDVFALDGDRKIAAELAHADEVVRETAP